MEMTMRATVHSNRYGGGKTTDMLTFLINAFRMVSSSKDDTNVSPSSGGDTAVLKTKNIIVIPSMSLDGPLKYLKSCFCVYNNVKCLSRVPATFGSSVLLTPASSGGRLGWMKPTGTGWGYMTGPVG